MDIPLFSSPQALCSDASDNTECSYLLSIFLLHDSADFARASCVALDAPSTPCTSIITTSRADLQKLLEKFLTASSTEAILGTLEEQEVAQLSIGEAAARAIGFLPLVM